MELATYCFQFTDEALEMLPQIEAELAKMKYDEWVEQKKRTVRIEILRPDLKGLRPAPLRTVTVGTGG